MNAKKLVAGLVAVVLLFGFPLVSGNPYYIHLVETIMIYAIVLFGLDIVVGYTGQVSLGHAGLFGIGAYTAGVLIMKMDAPVLMTLPIAVIVTAVFGALLALPALRVTGPYLAMVTLAFGTIVQILINEMDFLTNGPMGITLTKPSFFGHPMDETEYYWLVAVLLIASLVFVHRVLRSHLGRAFEALRGSPVASDCMGVSVYRYKVYAFVISAGLAGLAGALYAYSEQYISPNTYNFELTVLFLLAIIMGGRKTRTGALLGAAIIVLLPKLLDDLSLFRWVSVLFAVVVAVATGVALKREKVTPVQAVIPVVGSIALAGLSFVLETMTDWRLSIFGLITLFVVYYLQDGIVGFVRQALRIKAKPIGEAAPVAASGSDAISQAAARARRSAAGRQGRADAVRRSEGPEPGRSAGAARQHPRADRPERFRQEHHDECAHRHLCAHRRQPAVLGPIAGGAHLCRHRPVRHRPDLPERAALWRDECPAQRDGGPASQLPQPPAERGVAHAEVFA